ncbi:YggT family protein [Haloimpatiens sp. FM7330]|uniref:YggT family protein n=1 Tax=Haloimpatiens sp. FM7330 TaxID=3298610 RepID=UPI003633D905
MFIYFVNILFRVIEYAILIEVILSWIPQRRENQLTSILHTITEPFLRPGRIIQQKLIPNLMIDFSPIIALFIIAILRRVIYTLLITF